MFPEDYYSIEDAAKFLSKALNKTINCKGVRDIAASGRIRFCKRFDGSLRKFSIVNGALKYGEEREYGFRGVIGIPAERVLLSSNRLIPIPHERDVITFNTIEQIIEIERLYPRAHDPRLIEDGASWLGKVKPKERPCDKTEQATFVVHLHEIIIPEKDLNDFIEKTQATDTKNNHHIQESSNQISNNKPILQQEIPPGKLPPTTMGKLAIKVAWEFECKYHKKATANEVIKELQNRVNEEDILLEAIPHGVRWMTTKYKEKDYDLAACGKALASWNKSRDRMETETPEQNLGGI